MEVKSFKCDFSGCGLVYTHKRSLNFHLKDKHSVDNKKTLKCPNCEEYLKTIDAVSNHLEKIHSMVINKEFLTFSNYKAFEDFKKNLEASTGTTYVKNTGSRTVNSFKTSYFRCFRSGSYKKSGTNLKRMEKSSGTWKINNFCISSLTCKENIESGEVSVNYVKDHINHEIEDKHQRLSVLAKENIANLLTNGRTPSGVYETVCDDSSFKFLKMDDIFNVQKKIISDEPFKLDKDDLISIELNSKQDKNILEFKNFGSLKESLPELKKDDFLLVYMNQFQQETLKECLKGPFSCVCMDSTHGITQYSGLKMTTLMTIDEFHEGIGVAFMISNREDHEVIKIFLKAIKKQTGNLIAKYFISDGAFQFYQSWSCVFGSQTQKLNCLWHILKCWKEKVKNIKSKKKQEFFFNELRKIIYELDENNFESLKEEFLKKFLPDKETNKVAEYIRTFYFSKSKSWAMCFRKGSGITVNTSIESMHRFFKRDLFRGRPSKRLDSLLEAFVRYIKIYQNKYITKMVKGKNSKKLRKTFEHHKNAQLNFENYSISKILEENNFKKFEVFNKFNKNKFLIVFKETAKNHSCRFGCKSCDICICFSECSCSTYQTYKELCEHIHLIKTSIQNEYNLNDEYDENRKKIDLNYEFGENYENEVDFNLNDKFSENYENEIDSNLNDKFSKNYENEIDLNLNDKVNDDANKILSLNDNFNKQEVELINLNQKIDYLIQVFFDLKKNNEFCRNNMSKINQVLDETNKNFQENGLTSIKKNSKKRKIDSQRDLLKNKKKLESK